MLLLSAGPQHGVSTILVGLPLPLPVNVLSKLLLLPSTSLPLLSFSAPFLPPLTLFVGFSVQALADVTPCIN